MTDVKNDVTKFRECIRLQPSLLEHLEGLSVLHKTYGEGVIKHVADGNALVIDFARVNQFLPTKIASVTADKFLFLEVPLNTGSDDTSWDAIYQRLTQPVPRSSTFKVLLFDLDDTLIRSSLLDEFIKGYGRGTFDSGYESRLTRHLRADLALQIYSEEDLLHLQACFPQMLFSVYSDSPSRFMNTVLDALYPRVKWIRKFPIDRFSDIHNGVALRSLLELTGLKNSEAMVVGDDAPAIRCAYSSGASAALEVSHFRDKPFAHRIYIEGLVPDFIVKSVHELVDCLARPDSNRLTLEVSGSRRHRQKQIPHKELRYRKVIHNLGPDSAEIYVFGKLFANYETLQSRRRHSWLTQQIEQAKITQEPEDEWIVSLLSLVTRIVVIERFNCIVTVVPSKPGQSPRLERFLEALSKKFNVESPDFRYKTRFDPKTFRFKPDAKSHYRHKLKKDMRVANIRENLELVNPQNVSGNHVVVIDDVVTTGSTLVGCQSLLKSNGATKVTLLALAQTISQG